MQRSVWAIHRVVENPWYVALVGICSVPGFLWYLYDRISGYPTVASGIAWALALVFLIVGYVYSIKVRSENIALREIAGTFNEINRIYRRALQRMFWGQEPVTRATDLLSEERNVLRSVCQRIALIFERVIGRRCMVTVKLVTNDPGGKRLAHTYVRNMDNSERDREERTFEVGTSRNIAFDEALRKRSDGLPAHSFRADITKDRDYCNERQDYLKHYKSSIVVPIRAIDDSKRGTDQEEDLIGFLCVDTKSRNRLNDTYHIQLMSSLSEQMYNFISLMRGNYTVRVGEENDV